MQNEWFIIGWVIAAYLGIPPVGIAVVGALIAVIYYFYMYPVEARQAEEEA